jgi:hypothetical protein
MMNWEGRGRTWKDVEGRDVTYYLAALLYQYLPRRTDESHEHYYHDSVWSRRDAKRVTFGKKLQVTRSALGRLKHTSLVYDISRASLLLRSLMTQFCVYSLKSLFSVSSLKTQISLSPLKIPLM